MRKIIGLCVALIGFPGGIVEGIWAATSSPVHVLHPACSGGWEESGLCDRVTTSITGLHLIGLWGGMFGAVVFLIGGLLIAFLDIK